MKIHLNFNGLLSYQRCWSVWMNDVWMKLTNLDVDRWKVVDRQTALLLLNAFRCGKVW